MKFPSQNSGCRKWQMTTPLQQPWSMKNSLKPFSHTSSACHLLTELGAPQARGIKVFSAALVGGTLFQKPTTGGLCISMLPFMQEHRPPFWSTSFTRKPSAKLSQLLWTPCTKRMPAHRSMLWILQEESLVHEGGHSVGTYRSGNRAQRR